MTSIIDRITFTSPINIDNGYTSVPQGKYKSTMELTSYHQDGAIEPIIEIVWYINGLDEEIHIGINYSHEDDGDIVFDYDGVFELPEQAIQLLEKNDFDCSLVK